MKFNVSGKSSDDSTTGISFGLVTARSKPSNGSIKKSQNNRTAALFDSDRAKEVVEEKRVSTLISLGQQGVEEADVEEHGNAQAVIHCKNRLPQPRRHFAKTEHHYIAVRKKHVDTESPSENIPTQQTVLEPILNRNSKLARIREQKGRSGDTYVDEMQILPEYDPESYDNVPIEQFGMAMLLGMGYDPQKHTAQPLELKKRAYVRAGLGADKAFELKLEQQEQMTEKTT